MTATVVYSDASDIDPASIDATDLTLAGPSVAGAITLTSFDAASNTAVYSIAAPAGGWAEGAYTATVAASEVGDLADTPNLNVGGETGDVTLSFEDEPVVEFVRGDVRLAINAGGGVVDGAAYGLGDVDFDADTAAYPHPTVDLSCHYRRPRPGTSATTIAAGSTFTGLDLPDYVFTLGTLGERVVLQRRSAQRHLHRRSLLRRDFLGVSNRTRWARVSSMWTSKAPRCSTITISTTTATGCSATLPAHRWSRSSNPTRPRLRTDS